MTEHNPAGSPAKKHVPSEHRLARWGRRLVCVLTAGFMYPNAFVEDMDLTEIQGKTEGDFYNKK